MERVERGQAQPRPHRLELAALQERQRGGVCMGAVSACPQLDVLVEQVLPGGPASNLHT